MHFDIQSIYEPLRYSFSPYCAFVWYLVKTCSNMSSFVWSCFLLPALLTGPEICICIGCWNPEAKVLQRHPPWCAFYDQPAQSYNFTLLPFNIDFNKGLKCLYPANLLPPTVLLFYAIASLYCIAFCCPTNLWPSTVLLFML